MADRFLLLVSLSLQLETLVGTAPQHQFLELQNSTSGTVTPLEDESKTLADIGFTNLQVLHVVDKDPANYVHSTQVGEAPAPFVLSAEKEAARMEAMKIAKEQKAIADDAKALRVQLGDRCHVLGPAGSTDAPRVGTVAYIGVVHWAGGMWVGVKFDEPLGKNDGSVKGTRYFECPANHGSFVKPISVVPIESDPAHSHGHKCDHC